MFQKILIPVDFSDDSWYSISCLTHLPGIREITLLHVIRSAYLIQTPDRVNPGADYARLRLDELKSAVEFPRFGIRTMIEEVSDGNISDAIIRISGQVMPSVIIMGRRGKGVIESVLLGSTASDLLTYGHFPLLLLHPPGPRSANTRPQTLRCPRILDHVMMAVDLNEPVSIHLCLDEMPDTKELTLFHAVTSGDSDDEVQRAVAAAKAALAELAPLCQRPNLTVRMLVRAGDAANEILAVSDELDVSLIMMKGTSRHGLVQNLLGSTTEVVARTSRRPVYIMKEYHP